jgi:two-component system CheB/CheR fusion protein
MEKGVMVFVVDDDEAVRDSLGVLLGAHGLSVQDFGSAGEFLQSDHHGTAGCLLVDHHMEGMTGLDLIETLRLQKRPHVVILITGLCDASMRTRAEAAGVIAIFEKPLPKAELVETVKGAVRSIALGTDC